MSYEFKLFFENLVLLEGVKVFQHEEEPNTWIFFSCDSQYSMALLTAMIEEVGDERICKIVSLTHPVDSEKAAHQLVFHDDKERILKIFSTRIKQFLERQMEPKYDQYGVPDLSLVTIKQIARELKKRENLSFAMVWMEDSSKDNIAIEGNGNPTNLVGLLARGLHMAIEWSDKYLHFKKPDDDQLP